jgi:hypothetical protein
MMVGFFGASKTAFEMNEWENMSNLGVTGSKAELADSVSNKISQCAVASLPHYRSSVEFFPCRLYGKARANASSPGN